MRLFYHYNSNIGGCYNPCTKCGEEKMSCTCSETDYSEDGCATPVDSFECVTIGGKSIYPCLGLTKGNTLLDTLARLEQWKCSWNSMFGSDPSNASMSCSIIKNSFPLTNGDMNNNDYLFGVKGGNCSILGGSDVAKWVLNQIMNNQELKNILCQISCQNTTSCVAPANLQAVNVTSTGARISWNSVVGQTYNIYLNEVLHQQNISTPYEFNALTPFVDYIVRVEARGGACTPNSSTVRFRTISNDCPAPTNVIFNPLTKKLSWNSTGTQFILELTPTGSPMVNVPIIYNEVSPDYFEADLSLYNFLSNTIYKFCLKNVCQNGVVSGCGTCNGCPVNPNCVLINYTGTISKSNITANTVQLQWTPVNGVTAYGIVVNGGTMINIGNNVTYNVTGLLPGSTNSIQVKFITSDGCINNLGNELSVVTSDNCGIATGVSSILIDPTHYSVTWNSAPYANTYTVKYSKDNGVTWYNAITTSSTNNIVEVDDPLATYIFEVCANCGVSTSVPDLTVSQVFSNSQIPANGSINMLVAIRNISDTNPTTSTIEFFVDKLTNFNGATSVIDEVNNQVTVGGFNYVLNTQDFIIDSTTNPNKFRIISKPGVSIQPRGRKWLNFIISRASNALITDITKGIEVSVTNGTGGGEAPSNNNIIINTITLLRS